MGMRRVWCAAWRRRRALSLACCVLATLGVRVPAELGTEQLFPAHSPAGLAHALADFANQLHVCAPPPLWMYSYILDGARRGAVSVHGRRCSTSWSVEQDRSNYTTWRYTVSFSCGARCGGRAHVQAHDEPRAAAPQHGHAARLHRVAVQRRSCTGLPLLTWPQYCEELETNAMVAAAGSGAQLSEVARTRCSLLSWLSGACARWLRAERDLLLLRLREASITV